MQAKRPEKAAARRLRAEGRSLREISKKLSVSLSSVSVWTREVTPPQPEVPESLTIRWEAIRMCNGCGRLLFASRFHQKQAHCKDCRREYIRRRGELHRQQTRAARDKRRAAARKYIIEILRSGRCADCGAADPATLEFDHVGPKHTEVGKLVREAYRLDRVKAEIANCELVCANCHRRRTARRARSWRVEPEWRALHAPRPLRRRNYLFILEYLRGARCVDCGEGDPVVLDFDHVGPKRDDVVQLACDEHSIASLQREIDQCEVRCANCHRRRTIVDQGHFRHHLCEPP